MRERHGKSTSRLERSIAMGMLLRRQLFALIATAMPSFAAFGRALDARGWSKMARKVVRCLVALLAPANSDARYDLLEVGVPC